ncbi:MAG: ribonucleoside triphosphate reductase [Nanoarchaeota archaeon]|nr:ribonucleoside triphosphate reductase [Nanoarchaeota archaeon]
MPIEQIIRRDGEIVPFEQERITEAIWKAVKSVGGQDKQKAREVSDSVVQEIEGKFGNGRLPTVEGVQDIVQRVLIKRGHDETATAYIRYRFAHEGLRDVRTTVETISSVENYLGKEDWEVRENANMGFSLQGLNNFLAEKTIGNYWLNRVYPEEIRKTHQSGEFHIHDLGTLGPYCVGWDLEDLLKTGFKGVSGKVESAPAKHLRTALGQIVNFFYTLQGEAAGAQAFSSFDTLLAPFVRIDRLSYPEVKQTMQEFVFNLAVPTRVGFQTPFTNITMDLKVPDYMKDNSIVTGLSQGYANKKREKERIRLEGIMGSSYGDYQRELDMINRAFAEVMLEGDTKGRPFTFPIPTYNLTKDFDWENEKLKPVWKMAAKYGIPYFSNFINSDMDPEDARSMCCRLRIDNTELERRGGGLFGSNPLTGSIGVVTMNMPRLGYTSTSEEAFFGRLGELMGLARDSLEIKRKTLENFTNGGLYPYSKFYLRGVFEKLGKYWGNHFSTIGLLGMNEAIANLLPGENITTPRGHAFAGETLDFMREKVKKFQAETGQMYNLEATPGEGTTYRFAKGDKERFPNIRVANEENVSQGAKPYYTNSTQLPVGHTSNLFRALEMQDKLQTKYTGGTVFHAFLGESPRGEDIARVVRKIAETYHLPYFTITPTFSICPNHGYAPGEKEECPSCGEETEVWSRTVGYLRPVKQWNDGKQEEFRDRKMMNVREKR